MVECYKETAIEINWSEGFFTKVILTVEFASVTKFEISNWYKIFE